MNAIFSWLSVAGTFVVAKALPMVILTALGILTI